MFTRVIGTIRDSGGKLSKGAIIEAQLISQMQVSPGLVGNPLYQTESNSYGRFILDLAPCTLDAGKQENYYSFKVINNTTNYYNKIVPESVDPIDFDDLPSFTAPDLRTPFFGTGTGSNGFPIILADGDFSGLFAYIPIKGDGQTRVFSAPGKIHMVVLNGVVQNPTGDYVQLTSNSIEFVQAPLETDVILIQHKM